MSDGRELLDGEAHAGGLHLVEYVVVPGQGEDELVPASLAVQEGREQPEAERRRGGGEELALERDTGALDGHADIEMTELLHRDLTRQGGGCDSDAHRSVRGGGLGGGGKNDAGKNQCGSGRG